jgi:kynurenine formamidase
MKIVDLSVTLGEDLKDILPVSIRYEGHKEGCETVAKMVGVQPSDFEDGMALAAEFMSVTTHSGTHVDAPWHYAPTCGGKPSRTIDQMPLEWFYNDGVVLDFSGKPAGYAFTSADIQQELKRINYTLKPLDIVLVRSDTDKKIYDDDFMISGVGSSAEATHWLIDQGIKVMGTDAWGWDIPMKYQLAQFKAHPKPGILFAAHMVGKQKEYCQIEKMANLDQLPPFGFKVSCFPAKIKRGSGGWTRAVAIFP